MNELLTDIDRQTDQLRAKDEELLEAKAQLVQSGNDVCVLRGQCYAKDEAIKKALSYESTGVDYWREVLEQALKGSEYDKGAEKDKQRA